MLATWAVIAAGVVTLSLACSGDDGGIDVVVDPTATAEASATSEPGEPTKEPASPTAEPTAPVLPTEPTTGGGWVDDSPLVACNDILVPLSKETQLPSDCWPGDLVSLPAEVSWGGEQLMRAEAADAFIELVDAAAAEGHALFTRSTFRSYQEQVTTYQYWVSVYGREEADRTSARPGHSEHQLGTTADLTSASVGYELAQSFGDTPEGAWVRENAWKYGFVISYPAGKEQLTGYDYEPWHVRYVGKSVAEQVKGSGMTLTEFLR